MKDLVLLLGVLQLCVPALGQGNPPLELSLDEAVGLSIRNNLSLRSAILDEQIERERIREALGAFDPTFFAAYNIGRRESLFASNFPLDPGNPASPSVIRIISLKSQIWDARMGLRGVLDTGLSYELAFQSNYQKQEEDSGLNPIFNNSISVNVTQPILRSAWASYRTAPVENARLMGLRAHQSWRGAQNEKIKEVQQAYYDLVFAIADRELKVQSLELAQRQVALTRVKVDAGALPKVEVTSAESGEAGREANLVTAEAAVVEAEDRLRRLIMSFESPDDWEIRLRPTERPEEEPVTLCALDTMVRLAEISEPTLLNTHLQVAQAEVFLRQARSESQPTLDLVGSGTVVGLADDFWQAQSGALNSRAGAASWSVGLSFEYPLGNRSARSKVVQRELELKKAKLLLQDGRTELVFRIRTGMRNVEVARRSITARQKAARLAEEQLANERLNLELKKATNFQVFEVEEQVNQRKLEVVRAILDHKLALLDLTRTTGVPLSELLQQP